MVVLIVDALAANEGRRKFSRDAIGVGPRLLAGICEKNNKEVKIARVEDILENESYLNQTDFDVFLISGMSVDKIAVKRVIKQISKIPKDTTTFLGGPIVSDPDFLKEIDISAGIIGEGEFVLETLLQNDFSFHDLKDTHPEQLELTKIDNVWLIKQKVLTTESVFEKFLPSTDRIIDYPDFWFSKVYVEITRGCSNHYRGSIVKSHGGCSDCGNCDNPDTVATAECPEDIPPGCGFCSVPSTFGPPRSKSKELVVKEIKELLNKGARRIILSSPGFFDYFRESNDNPTYSPTKPSANLEKITDLLSELAQLRDEQEEICSISVENVKPSLVTEAGAGIIGKFLPRTAISIGCETFDIGHSSAIGRPSSSNQTLEAARLFRSESIDPQIYLIHSLPGETADSLNTTREVVNGKLKDYAEKITVYKYLALPNSPFTVTNTPLPVERHLIKDIREKLKKDIISFNRSKKRELIGKHLQVIVAEKDFQHKNHYISYPIFSGPTISIHSSKDILRKTVLAEVIEVITDRLVKAELKEILG
ncbi:MAG: radical SAM protein [Candidatus Heimdallarchaeota archaeon]|nr:radical SAM protein [Candidatus Heimdallarchaeota archaeon]